MTRPVMVVKLGGRAQGDPALPAALAALTRAGRLCVVHGGGDAISALQRSRGDTPQFVGGRRVTTAADIDVIRMALSGLTNKQLVAALRGAGLPAVGLSGEDGGLIVARPTGEAHMGLVGAPATVNVELLALLFDGGYVPVLSPLAASAAEEGAALNVNGDDAASAIAVALGAAELFFMADVPGVLDAGSVIPTLDPDAADRLVSSGVAAGGMAAKLEAARSALDGGVGRVRIGDLAALGDPSLGTSIVSTSSTVSTGHAHRADATAAPGSTGSPITQSAV